MVFQQVIPSKRLVHAMSPRTALLSYSRVSAESLRKDSPQARPASSSATVRENGPSSQSSSPASEKSRSSTEQEAESSSSRQLMFPVGERSSSISRAPSGAGETGSSSVVSSSVGSSVVSWGADSALVVELSRVYCSSSGGESSARAPRPITARSTRASTRQPPQAIHAFFRLPSSASSSSPDGGPAGADGAAEAAAEP